MGVSRWCSGRPAKLLLGICLLLAFLCYIIPVSNSNNLVVKVCPSCVQTSSGLLSNIQATVAKLETMIGRSRTDKYKPPCDTASVECYSTTLASRASPDRVVLVAMTDTSFADMALNFYLFSIQPHGITNYLFLGVDQDACRTLHDHGVACYVYSRHTNASSSSAYGSFAFIEKVNVRPRMILDALRLNYTVLSSDVDIAMVKNPFPYLQCRECDMELSWDFIGYNSGFAFIHPTNTSKLLYENSITISAKDKHIHDQHSLNMAIKDLNTKNPTSVHINKLLSNVFQNGWGYFEAPGRHFAGIKPCSACVTIHNNWIRTKEAKIYRFKENHMWVLDTDMYYSDPGGRYMTYSNTPLGGNSSATWSEQKATLANALAISILLNRTLILPVFHCGELFCPLNSLFHMVKFDKTFSSLYREHSFLTHPLVPDIIKNSNSSIITINTNITSLPLYAKINNDDVIFTPAKPEEGATSQEVRNWFSNRPEAVLCFGSLYGAFGHFDKNHAELAMQVQEMLLKGLVPGDYRQTHIIV